MNNPFIFLIFDFYDISAHWSQFFYSLFQAIVCILGICGNIVAGFILSRREMRNAFNLLLVTLACFDSTYVSIILVQCCHHLESINLWVSSFFYKVYNVRPAMYYCHGYNFGKKYHEMKYEKTMLVFVFHKYRKFWRVLSGQKPLISEKCYVWHNSRIHICPYYFCISSAIK